MPVNKALRRGKELSVDGSDGSGGHFLTSELLYGQTGCHGGLKSRKKAAWLMKSPQDTNPDGASAKLCRRTAKQAERGDEELQFDVSNP